VQRGIDRCLRPYLHRLAQPEPVVSTALQAAAVLQVSVDTVWRLVKRGVLPRVPHLEGKLLIPREAVDRLVNGAEPDYEPGKDVSALRPSRRRS
jgi:excisionase family DNA binding protein